MPLLALCRADRLQAEDAAPPAVEEGPALSARRPTTDRSPGAALGPGEAGVEPGPPSQEEGAGAEPEALGDAEAGSSTSASSGREMPPEDAEAGAAQGARGGKQAPEEVKAARA